MNIFEIVAQQAVEYWNHILYAINNFTAGEWMLVLIVISTIAYGMWLFIDMIKDDKKCDKAKRCVVYIVNEDKTDDEKN